MPQRRSRLSCVNLGRRMFPSEDRMINSVQVHGRGKRRDEAAPARAKGNDRGPHRAALLPVLCLTESEALASRCKFAQLMTNHLFGDVDGYVILSVVHEESESMCRRECRSHERMVVRNCPLFLATHPTKFGSMVHARALVRIGVLVFRAWARLGKATKKGPAVIVNAQEVWPQRGADACHMNTYLSRRSVLGLWTWQTCCGKVGGGWW